MIYEEEGDVFGEFHLPTQFEFLLLGEFFELSVLIVVFLFVVHMRHLVFQGLAVDRYGEILDIRMVGEFSVFFLTHAPGTTGWHGLEADQQGLLLAGIEELVIDVDQHLVVLPCDVKDFFFDSDLGLGNRNQLVARGVVNAIVSESHYAKTN